MMSRRQMLMMLTEEQGLPSEYLQVEYLEGTGTQYIDTLYSPTANTSVQLEYSLSADISGAVGLFGQSSSQRIKAEIRYSTRWYISSAKRHVNYPSGISGTGYSANVKYTLVADENGASINGVSAEGTNNANSNTDSIYLFALNNSGSAYEIINVLRVHSFKLFESGALSYDLIPCIRISDSKPGMYDLVGRQFYTNAGTGEFKTDYTIILPDNPTETGAGFFTTASFPLLNQQKITLKYFGIGNRTSNVFFDGYTARTSPNQLVYTRDLTANDGEYNLTATRDGTLYIGISRNGTVGSTSAFYIKSILLKIE